MYGGVGTILAETLLPIALIVGACHEQTLLIHGADVDSLPIWFCKVLRSGDDESRVSSDWAPQGGA
jgi:hypothetical protein